MYDEPYDYRDEYDEEGNCLTESCGECDACIAEMEMGYDFIDDVRYSIPQEEYA
jgi:hypothetical protein